MRWSALALNKPYYVLRPSQLVRRLLRAGRGRPRGEEFESAVLPWGLTIRFRPGEMIGSSIARTGLYDLSVSEVIYRLIDPGELAVDVGANIGHMVSLMAVRVGPAGRVIAFEPQPDVFAELSYNVERWKGHPGCERGSLARPLGRITALEMALSDHSGKGSLLTPEEFQQNRGTASLVCSHPSLDGQSTIDEVSLARLDELFQPDDRIGLLKLDVEGHEIHVLRGAAGMLDRGQIRDLIVEEHAPYPTEVTRCLEAAGFTLFRLGQSFWGPEVRAATAEPMPAFGPRAGSPDPLPVASTRRSWDPPSYLATRDPERAVARLRARGWRALGR
jgi:FkbM family methyltransferase